MEGRVDERPINYARRMLATVNVRDAGACLRANKFLQFIPEKRWDLTLTSDVVGARLNLVAKVKRSCFRQSSFQMCPIQKSHFPKNLESCENEIISNLLELGGVGWSRTDRSVPKVQSQKPKA